MPAKIEIKDPKSSAQARGRRLKTARMMTGLTRNALEQKYGISASTIQSWEAAKAGGLTERGVKRILNVLHQEGVACTGDWLLYGIGPAPQPTGIQAVADAGVEAQLPEDKAIIQELLHFRQLHREAVDMLVTDDGMEPHYLINDHVAGKRRTGRDIADIIGMDCIVQTAQNDIQFRRVMKGSQPGRYNLVCTNINTSYPMPVLYDQQLLSAAPVVWHRRHDHSH